MTLCNLVLSDLRVVACSDTLLCTTDGEPVGLGSNLSVLPHMTAVAVCRGPRPLRREAEEHLSGGDVLGGVDEAAPSLSTVLRAEAARLAAWFGEEAARADYWLAGWSGAESRFVGWRFLGDHEFKPERVPVGLHLNPPVAGSVPLPTTATVQQLVRLAEAQKRMLERQTEAGGSGGPGIGGDLIMGELTRVGMAIRKVHRFDNHTEVVAKLKKERHQRQAEIAGSV